MPHFRAFGLSFILLILATIVVNATVVTTVGCGGLPTNFEGDGPAAPTGGGWVASGFDNNVGDQRSCANGYNAYAGSSAQGSLRSNPLVGSGLATIYYGDCWGEGYTTLYKNDVEIDRTEANRAGGSKRTKTFAFEDGDVLMLKDEGNNAVLWIGSITFSCESCGVLFGTFVTNEGNEFSQNPFKVGDDTYVFGGFDGGYFKMSSLNAQGQFQENRYSSSGITDIESLTLDIWNNASRGGSYSVKNTLLQNCGAVNNACRDADVRLVEALPEIFYQGDWYPLCGHWLWNNDLTANTFCQKLGYTTGAAKRVNTIFDRNAMPVGICNPGESLDSCTGGGNYWGDLDGESISCTAGQPVGVHFTCSGGSYQTSASCSVAVDCVGSFASWDSCDITCGGGGTHSRTYAITTPANHDGIECDGANGDTESEACGATECPACEDKPNAGQCLEDWNWNWAAAKCSYAEDWCDWEKSDEQNWGYEARNCCPLTCDACPVDCVGSFGSWDSCDVTCGGGTHSRTYAITTPAAHDGMQCEAANGDTESQACGATACPVDCVGSFGSLDSCDVTCGGGTHSRTYAITTPAAHGGMQCDAANGDTESQACGATACPVDCVGSFASWDSCDVTCGGGTHSRTFAITTPAANGGMECEAANGDTESQACGATACPVDCVGSFASWDICDVTCGGGTHSRTYAITIPAAHGGMECDAANGDTESQACGATACPECPDMTCQENTCQPNVCDTLVGSSFLTHSYHRKIPTTCYPEDTTKGGGMEIAVSCCDGDGGGYRPDCSAVGMDWASAQAKCESYGFRLCTLTELHNLTTFKLGCGFDVLPNWAYTNCDGCTSGPFAPNGTSCDDGILTTTHDTCSNGVCSGIPGHQVISSDVKFLRLYPRKCEDSTATISSQDSTSITVTCCDDSGVGSRPGCAKGLNYFDAKTHCEANSLRLCTVAEIQGGAGVRGGCHADASHTWALDDCTDETDGTLDCPDTTCPLDICQPQVCDSLGEASFYISSYGGGRYPLSCYPANQTIAKQQGIAVSCCNDVGVGYRPDCSAVGLDWASAQAKCQSYGLRLCTQKEWDTGALQYQGCNFDWGPNWLLDSCDGCAPGPFAPSGTPCDDGNLTTTQDSCSNGVCSGIPDVVVSMETNETVFDEKRGFHQWKDGQKPRSKASRKARKRKNGLMRGGLFEEPAQE